jgi:hypothetical protein
MDQYNRFLAKSLAAKRYKMINAFDLTAGESNAIDQYTAAVSKLLLVLLMHRHDLPRRALTPVLSFFPAFTYDSATQMDGMHIVGPPMKMIVTKLFHYVCKDVVDGMIV